MKILHIGLCVQPEPYNGFQKAFIDIVGKENYDEVYTGDQTVNIQVQLLASLKIYDIIFFQVQAENIIAKETFIVCKDSGAYVINWTGDKRHEVPQWMIEIAPFVSCTSFSNMEDVHKMRALGFHSEFLEIGYDPEIYTPEGEAYEVPEIVFMGNNYGDGHFPMSKFRREMVEFLQMEYGERFGVYGNGWTNPAGNVNHSQHEEAKIYRGAKIAINCSHFDCDTYNSDRLLRILGCGVRCISYQHKNMESVFDSSIDVGYFSTFEILKNQINTTLSTNPEVVKTFSMYGNTKALNNFTFRHQVMNIIKLAS